MIKQLLLFSLITLLFGCKSAQLSDKSYNSQTLVIEKVRDNVYQHISFLETQSFGRVSCNGMIVFDKNEAVIFNTPNNDSTSAELINWIRDNLHCKVIAIIPTHFHQDCLGGLKMFHERGMLNSITGSPQ